MKCANEYIFYFTLDNAEKYLKLNGQMGINGGFVCLLQRQVVYR